jgi:hypothetical protein
MGALFFATVLLISIATFGFWVWMLVECLTREEGSDKIAWLLALIFLPFIGTLLYFFIRHPVNQLPAHLRRHA